MTANVFDQPVGAAEFAAVVARIHALCDLPDGELGCWLWKGSRSSKPLMSFRGHPTAVRRVVFFLREGVVPGAGQWVTCCGHPDCVSMHCARAMVQSKAQQRAARRGAYSQPEANRNRLLAARARAVYGQELVEQLLQMPGSCAEVARSQGMSRAYVSALRRGLARVPVDVNARQARTRIKHAAALRAELDAAREHAMQVHQGRLKALRAAQGATGVWAGLMA